MASIVQTLYESGQINCPSFVATPHYETIMGSEAYGVSNGGSDVDVYGFCIPSKDIIFPHLAGEIYGFGKQIQRFEQWQQHHIHLKEREYDIQIYNIVKYFQLCMDNNPNMIDSMFTPDNCVIHSSNVGRMVRAERKSFLHKGAYHKFRGYAFSSLNKAKTKQPVGKRKELIEKFGWDVKFLYHTARLCDECEQILTLGDLDLQRSKEYMKAIRSGAVTPEEVEKWFYEKEKQLEKLYHESTAIPYSPDEEKIKALLLHCIEEFYGSVDGAIKHMTHAETLLRNIKLQIEKAGF